MPHGRSLLYRRKLGFKLTVTRPFARLINVVSPSPFSELFRSEPYGKRNRARGPMPHVGSVGPVVCFATDVHEGLETRGTRSSPRRKLNSPRSSSRKSPKERRRSTRDRMSKRRFWVSSKLWYSGPKASA